MNAICIHQSTVHLIHKYPTQLLENHLEECNICQQELEKLNENSEHFKKLIPLITPNKETKQRCSREVKDLVRSLAREEFPKKRDILKNFGELINRMKLIFNR